MSEEGGPELQVGSDVGQLRVRPGAELVVGRGAECDLTIGDLRVSRRHLSVSYLAGEGWVVRDLGSAAGTFRGRERVQRCVVGAPLVLRLGDADLGPAIRLQAGGSEAPSGGTPPGAFRVGRAADNDLVLPDLVVSRHHAELRRLDRESWEVLDLGSRGGTFVDGRRVTREVVRSAATVIVGGRVLGLSESGVRLVEQRSAPVLEAAGASAILPSGQKILDDVTFSLEEGTLLALLGPTGSGKSTLLKTLTGFRPPEAGKILVNGLDLYEASDELRQRIGYVPQDDILHPQLTVRRALRFSAELRFPPDVSQDERERRVDEVIGELGLTQRADVAIDRLSGGQRKRTSVAMELLTKPSLLLLDEPTSGLDPGYEKSVTEQLRRLADGGRVVVVVTHSVQSLGLCHKVLFLAPGGTLAFLGPPAQALEFFDRSQYASVFQELEASPPGRWKQSSVGDEAKADDPFDASGLPAEVRAPVPWARQVSTLCRRHLAVLLADRRNLLYLLAEVLIPALLILALVGRRSFAPGIDDNPHGLRTLLGALAISATAVGAANSVREVVKELPLYYRERAVGLSRSAYLVGKAIVLGALTALQVAILVLIATRGSAGPATSVWPGSATLELIVDLALGGIAAMCLGLLLSTMVSSSEKAMALVPVVFIVTWLFSGMAVDLQSRPLMLALGYATSANWSMSMASSSSGIYEVEDKALSLQGLPAGGVAVGQQGPPPRDARWESSVINWIVGAVALVLLSAASLAVADWELGRKEPFTRRRDLREKLRGGRRAAR